MALGRQFVVRIDGLQKLNKKFKRIQDFASIKVGKLSEQQAQEGASMAASLAPFDTGALIQAIAYQRGRGTAWEIVSRQPKKQRNRPYHLWMHGLDGRNTGPYIKTGDERYMFTTYEALKSSYPKKISSELNKTISR